MPVVRIDFTDADVWERVKAAITAPSDEGFLANVEFVEASSLSGLDVGALVTAVPRRYPDDYEHPVLFVFDAATVASTERPLLVLSLDAEDATPPFRVIPSQVHAIENNLAIANMDYFEFAGGAGPDGVFRGF